MRQHGIAEGLMSWTLKVKLVENLRWVVELSLDELL
jgi:hypothetical protein